MNPRNTLSSFLSTRAFFAAFAVFALAFAPWANAQIGTINSANYHPREYNDASGSTLTVISNYPSQISFNDQGVSSGNFANRHVWRFSSDGGATAYQFQNNGDFRVQMTLSLTGTPSSPRKEAGFLFDTLGGQGQFIVNTDAHEVVAFGGPLPFFAFAPTFNSGDTITLGMTYFLQANGRHAIIYSANGINSPTLEFSNAEFGIIDGSTLGGYLQIVKDSTNPSNGGSAVFQNISINSNVPEPTALALVGVGALGLLWRRRLANTHR